MVRLAPRKDFLLVKSLPLSPDLRIGLIHIPQVGQVPPRQGTVERVGPLVRDVGMGDRVIFSKHAGSRIGAINRADNSSYLILRERDVIAVIG